MKKSIMICLLILFVSCLTQMVYAGGKVYGTVKYRSGTLCKHCKVEIESEGGFQSTTTDGNGRYSLSVKGCYINKVWVYDKRVWTGSKDSCGGLKLNLTID